MNIVRLEQIEDKLIIIQGEKVLLDSDVAEVYSVETKRINEAVKNNPDKFPDGYIVALTKDEFANLRSKFSTSSWGGRRYSPRAFTERGLYMLATILKGDVAIQTTLAIIDTFCVFRRSRTPKPVEAGHPVGWFNPAGLGLFCGLFFCGQ